MLLGQGNSDPSTADTQVYDAEAVASTVLAKAQKVSKIQVFEDDVGLQEARVKTFAEMASNGDLCSTRTLADFTESESDDPSMAAANAAEANAPTPASPLKSQDSAQLVDSPSPAKAPEPAQDSAHPSLEISSHPPQQITNPAPESLNEEPDSQTKAPKAAPMLSLPAQSPTESPEETLGGAKQFNVLDFEARAGLNLGFL